MHIAGIFCGSERAIVKSRSMTLTVTLSGLQRGRHLGASLPRIPFYPLCEFNRISWRRLSVRLMRPASALGWQIPQHPRRRSVPGSTESIRCRAFSSNLQSHDCEVVAHGDVEVLRGHFDLELVENAVVADLEHQVARLAGAKGAVHSEVMRFDEVGNGSLID